MASESPPLEGIGFMIHDCVILQANKGLSALVWKPQLACHVSYTGLKAIVLSILILICAAVAKRSVSSKSHFIYQLFLLVARLAHNEWGPLGAKTKPFVWQKGLPYESEYAIA